MEPSIDSHSCQMYRHNNAMTCDIRGRFGKRLKELREKADCSVSELAKRSGVSRQHIRDLELPFPEKRVTIVTLEKLAKGLGLPIWKLLQFKDR